MGPVFRLRRKALCKQLFQRLRHGEAGHSEIFPAVHARNGAGIISAICPGLIAQIHFKDTDRPGVDVGLSCEGLSVHLLHGAVMGRAPAGGGNDGLAAIHGDGTHIHIKISQHSAGFCKAKVRHLCRPRLCQKQVVRLYVLMDAPLLMGVVQTTGKLNGNVQNAHLLLIFTAHIQAFVLNAVFKAAVLHPL